MCDEKIYQFKVDEGDLGPERMRNYLLGKFPYLETNSAVKKALRNRYIILNGSIAHSGDWVKQGDQIEFRFPICNTEEDVVLDVCYEDEEIIIVNKPFGILSSGNSKDSIQRRLQSYASNISSSAQQGQLPYPLLVHRLDRDTGGLLIAAKTIHAKRALDKMLKDGKIEKYYIALVQGDCQMDNVELNFPIDGKPSKTKIISCMSTNTADKTTLLRLNIDTGRTHQIRKHLSEIGFPIVGDQLYNKDGLTFRKGLFLASNELSLFHPTSKKRVELKIELPKKFGKYMT